MRIGNGSTAGGIGIGIGETNLNSGSLNTVNTGGYPFRAYTSSDGTSAVIAGGDYTAEFTDAPALFLTGGSQSTTVFAGASYDSAANATTVQTGGGLGQRFHRGLPEL